MIDLNAEYLKMGIDKRVIDFVNKNEKKVKERFEKIDEVASFNFTRVLNAFRNAAVSEADLGSTTGYGYNDTGREKLEKIFAELFGAESALVRPSITCGTHALAIALSANLRPGDELLSPVGKPYDTLEGVIGIRSTDDIFDSTKRSMDVSDIRESNENADETYRRHLTGSLAEYGVTYRQVDLKEDESFDFEGIKAALNEKTKLVTIQRSKGYQTRHTFSVEEIGELCKFIKDLRPDVAIMVDNCYGEFIEPIEPGMVGADLVVGSLIKNAGGSLAPIGGYIAGREDLVENCAYRLNAPGLGREVGATLGLNRNFFHGLFLAPTVTAAAVKGSILLSSCFEEMGFKCVPAASEERHDIIQSIVLGTAERVIAFAQGIQAASPIDSNVTPEPWPMPGYHSDVIMAAGTFVSGASIELSADAPLEEPYAIYYQGGITYPHAKAGILMAIQKLYEKNLIEI